MSRLTSLAGRLGQAGIFNARENRRGRADPGLGLFVTHRYAPVTQVIPPAQHPAEVRNRPITMAMDIVGSDTQSMIVGIGGSAFAGRAFSVAILGNNLFLKGGAQAPANDGAFVGTSPNPPLVEGERGRIVAACNPGTGQVEMWLNGISILRATSVDGNMGPGWGEGLDGEIVLGSTPIITSDIEVFVGQRPRQMYINE